MSDRMNMNCRESSSQHQCSGSAIVFWHEAQGCPPSVKAIPLSSIVTLDSGVRVTEKTVCRAKYRGCFYPCIVLWIEEDKTPDELAMSRLLPQSNEKIFEDKGLRWSEELRMTSSNTAESLDMMTDVDEEESSCVEKNGIKPEFLSEEEGREPSELHESGVAYLTSVGLEMPAELSTPYSAYDSSVASASTCESLGRIESNLSTKLARLDTDRLGSHFRKQGRRLPTQAHRLEGTLAAIKQYKLSVEKKATKLEQRGNQGISGSSNRSDVKSSDEALLKKMLLQSTWTKALRCALHGLFSVDEMATSLPHMSKSGMKVLDQCRLTTAKDLVYKCCTAKNMQHPSKRQVSQAVHNCLISCRTTKYPMKRFAET